MDCLLFNRQVCWKIHYFSDQNKSKRIRKSARKLWLHNQNSTMGGERRMSDYIICDKCHKIIAERNYWHESKSFSVLFCQDCMKQLVQWLKEEAREE